MTLTAGSSSISNGSNAVVESTGSNFPIKLRMDGLVQLMGGTAANQRSLIQTTFSAGLNPINLACHALEITGGAQFNTSAAIHTLLGAIKIFASSSTTMTGGSSGANALVHADIQGSIALATGQLTVTAGTNGSNAGIQTAHGNIGVASNNDVTFSTLDAISQALIETLGSDLLVAAGGSINLSGNTLYSTPDPGNMLLTAGVNISIGPTVNIIANGTTASSLTLVVDELHPIPPGIGPGQFILDTGATLQAGAITTPVRIFTARREQNTINAPINTVAFVPGTEFVDTPTEQWDVYFPSAFYGGTGFTLFYKNTSNPVPPAPPVPPAALSSKTIAAILYRAAFLDSELFYDLSYTDWYAFEDLFYFSSFDVCLDRDQASNSDPQIYKETLTSYDLVDDKGLSIRRGKWLNQHNLIY